MIWNVNDWDDLSLWVLRLSLALFGVLTLMLIASHIRNRKGWKRIPKNIRVFAVFWLLFWSSLAVYVFVTQSNPFGEWFRTIYGAGYLGTMWGLSWCLWHTTKPDPDCGEGRCRFHEILVNAIEEELSKEDVGNRAEREGGDSQ